MTDADEVRRRIAAVLAQYVPCICSRAYTGRGLVAPDCYAHDAQDAMDELVAIATEPTP